MTWVAAAVGAVSLGYGIYNSESQKSKANKIAKNNQFVPQTMPAQVKQATDLAAQNYTNGMPGMQYQKAAIDRNTTNAESVATKGASSGGDVLDSANKIQLGANDATQQLALQAASYKSSALGGYESALNNEAGWQDKLYQNNELQPYLRAANTAASLEGAAHINEAGAIDNGLTSAQTVSQNFQNEKYRKYLMSKGTTPAQSTGTGNPYTGVVGGMTDTPIDTGQLLGISQYSMYT